MDFKVTYRVEVKSTVVKPLLLAAVAFGFLLIFIMSFRVDLAINRARVGDK
jgi:ABC-type spermidine/putrescine transport system permease subunit II